MTGWNLYSFYTSHFTFTWAFANSTDTVNMFRVTVAVPISRHRQCWPFYKNMFSLSACTSNDQLDIIFFFPQKGYKLPATVGLLNINITARSHYTSIPPCYFDFIPIFYYLWKQNIGRFGTTTSGLCVTGQRGGTKPPWWDGGHRKSVGQVSMFWLAGWKNQWNRTSKWQFLLGLVGLSQRFLIRCWYQNLTYWL